MKDALKANEDKNLADGNRLGRPRKHADNAARQRAYRARQREKGMRESKTWVRDMRDDSLPLVSDIIDLSEVRTYPRK